MRRSLYIQVLLLSTVIALLAGCGDGEEYYYFRMSHECISLRPSLGKAEVEVLNAPSYRTGYEFIRIGKRWLVSAGHRIGNDDGAGMARWILLDESATGDGYDLIWTSRKEMEPDLRMLAKLEAEERIPLFMMRVPDPQFVDFLKLWKERDLDKSRSVMMELRRPYNKNRLIRLAEIDLALTTQDNERCDELIKSYEDSFGNTGFLADEFAIESLQRTRGTRRLDQEGKNISALLGSDFEDGSPVGPSTEDLLDRFAAVTHDYTTRSPNQPMVMRDAKSPFPLRDAARAACVEADFALIRGERERALDILFGVHQFGAKMSEEGNEIGKCAVGAVIRGNAWGGLELAFLDGMETADEIAAEFPRIRQAHLDEASLVRAGASGWEKFYLGDSDFNGVEKERLQRLAIAATTVAAIAARHHYLITNDWPRTPEDFELMLPDGLPDDPYAPNGEMIRFGIVPERDEVFAVYSLGPDGKDDHAAIKFDRNLTSDRGDIFVDVPAERKYPFPPKGQLATTLTGLVEQFPNGLPYDVCAPGVYCSYTITNTDPAWIISVGPDWKIDERTTGVKEVETAESRARFAEWAKKGKRGPAPPRVMKPVITVETPESKERYRQWIQDGCRGSAPPPEGQAVLGELDETTGEAFDIEGLDSGDGLARSGEYYLYRRQLSIGQVYDPTNGIKSAGDIFMNTADPTDRNPWD
ncbi:hypothetical protein KQI84_05695 [bacterium]|nr:hypothetical protein [bacterium]